MGKANNYIMIEIDKAIEIQTALQKQFSYDDAFEMIGQINNIKLEINEIGKRPRLVFMYNYEIKRFKKYCNNYKVDFKLIINEFRKQKIMKAL